MPGLGRGAPGPGASQNSRQSGLGKNRAIRRMRSNAGDGWIAPPGSVVSIQEERTERAGTFESGAILLTGRRLPWVGASGHRQNRHDEIEQDHGDVVAALALDPGAHTIPVVVAVLVSLMYSQFRAQSRTLIRRFAGMQAGAGGQPGAQGCIFWPRLGIGGR